MSDSSPIQKDMLRLMQFHTSLLEYLGRDSSGQHDALPVGGQIVDDPSDGVLEAHLEDSVDLVNHQDFCVIGLETGCALEMLEETARSADYYVHPLNVLSLEL